MPAPKKKQRRRLNIKRLILLIVLLGLIIGGGVGVGFVAGVVRNMPNWQPDNIEANLTTFFYDRNGQRVANVFLENRIPVSFDQIPETVKHAFLAIEDHQFYKHNGINLYRIAGAVWANIRHGWGSQGGSTITMQLANKAFIDHHEKKLERKIQEAILALQLERLYSKDEIFEMYLNLIYFGNGAHGVQAASHTYFGKDVSQLDLAESALLAGMIQRPSTYNPYKNPDRAKSRRNLVLDQMARYGYITKEEAEQAKNQEIVLNNKPQQQQYNYPFFIDHAIEETEDILETLGIDPMELYRSGLHVYTTMDAHIQETMEKIYQDPDNFPPSKTDTPVQSAMVVLDHRTGEILGIIGGREHVTLRGLNRATQMKRSPGSVIKPLVVYGAALEKGFSPATVIDDVPVSYPAPGKPYQPRNYDGRWRGLITMREAIKHSVNIPAVKMLDTIGVDAGLEFGRRLGLSLTDADRNLSLALGGVTRGFSPLEIASAYGAFANKGIRIEPYAVSKIVDNQGNVIYEAKPRQHVVMSEETAYLMTDMLKSVVQSGTGTRAKMNRPVAGKTGTVQLPDLPEFKGKTGNMDAWWAAYTPEYVGVVWMGYDKTDAQHYLNQIYGGRYPAQIWKAVMEEALKDVPVVDFEKPANIVYRTVDAKSGLLPSGLTPAPFVINEIFHKDHVPKEESNVWVEAQVCADSGYLPSPHCPNVLTGIFLKRPIPYDATLGVPEDADLELPAAVCPVHSYGQGWPPDTNFTDPGRPEENPHSHGRDPAENGEQPAATSPPTGPEAPALGGQIREEGGKVTVVLSWNSVGSQGGIVYSVERWTKDNPTRYSIGLTTETVFEDSKVEKGQTYYYRVFAIDDNNLSTPSNEITVIIH
ncbi:MAG TPA: PBP1A family penicillin-binding protein [Clostridia bacterium]|nr:PBP1A family penicillin-binding protein [Clostridia bacterium]